MAAMLVAVGVAFIGSLAIKTDDGVTLASKMGIVGDAPTTEFAVVEGKAKTE